MHFFFQNVVYFLMLPYLKVRVCVSLFLTLLVMRTDAHNLIFFVMDDMSVSNSLSLTGPTDKHHKQDSVITLANPFFSCHFVTKCISIFLLLRYFFSIPIV